MIEYGSFIIMYFCMKSFKGKFVDEKLKIFNIFQKKKKRNCYGNIMISIYAKYILHRLVQVLFRLD